MEHTDPIALFDAWFAQAQAAEPNDPNAMALATLGPDGQPSLRMVLLKGRMPHAQGPDGFVFYTNAESRKGAELAANRKVALLFHWKSLRRQIRIEGPVVGVSDATADAYFASRGRDSQLGAWASDQSRPLASRASFEARFAAERARFDGQPVPRPPHWHGFCVIPDAMEFWMDGTHRLHERRRYTRDADDLEGGWHSSLLYP